MSDRRDQDEPLPVAAPAGGSLLRFAVTGIVVLLLIAGGVMTGARLWPNVTTVERRVVSPIRAAPAPTPAEQLPDLVDAACPAIVRLFTAAPPAPAPAPSPTPAPTSRRKHGRRHRGTTGAAPATPAPVDQPLPLDGVLVSADGYMITSAERLDAAPGPVEAQLDDGRRLPAARIASDPLTGVALLKIDATDLPFLQWADDGAARTGTWGFALSTPAGAGCVARTGLVSGDSFADAAPRRSYLRIAAYPGPDAEGAPFLGADGKLIAIGAFASAGDAQAGGDLMLPAAVASQATDAMIRNGKPPASPFGLFAADLDPTLAARLGADRLRGAAILLVAPGSPADRAGLRAGDVVVSAGTTPVSGATELQRALDPAADSIPLDVARDGGDVSIVLKP